MLKFTDVDFHKESLQRFRDSLIARCNQSGVNIKLNTEVTGEYIEAMKPDAVICAVGSRKSIPPIPGIEQATHALDAYDDLTKIGDRVVLIGGGLVGCETAYFLAETGHKVHILEMRDALAIDANDSHRRALLPRLVKTTTAECSVMVKEVKANGVRYTDADGVEHFAEADTIVFATGMRPNSETVEKLRRSAPWFVSVGDCVGPRQIKQATYEAFCAAMDIL